MKRLHARNCLFGHALPMHKWVVRGLLALLRLTWWRQRER